MSPSPDSPGLKEHVGRRDALIALGVALTATAFQAFYFNHGVHNLIDLALPAQDGARILEGEVYGRDFIAPYGPARYYLIAGVFYLFGTGLYPLNLLFLAVSGLNTGLTYLTARRLVPRCWALMAAGLVMMAHGSLHKGFFLFSGLLVAWALLGFVAAGGRHRALALGLALGFAGLFRWDVGLAGLVATTVIVFVLVVTKALDKEVRPPRMFVEILLGFGLIFAPIPIALAIAGRLSTLVEATVRRSSAGGVANRDYESWFALFTAPDPRARLFSIIVIVLLAGLVALIPASVAAFRRGAYRRATGLLALFLTALPLLHQVHLIIRFNRLLQAGPLLFTAWAVTLSLLWRRAAKVRSRLTRPLAQSGIAAVALAFAGLLGGYLYTFTGFASQDSFAVLKHDERFLDVPRARCWIRKGLAKDLEELLDYLGKQTAGERWLFADPACGLVPFLAGKRSPLPYTDWPYYFHDPEEVLAVRKALEAKNVQWVVTWPDRKVASFSLAEACPVLTRYLKKRFRPVWSNSRFTVLTRRP